MSEPGQLQVALFSGRGMISRLIRWQTRSQYSHAALTRARSNVVLESWQGKGVREKRLMDWRDVTRFDVDCTEEQGNAAWQVADGKIGAGYDYRAIFRFMSRRKHKVNTKWFCSELVFVALQCAGVNLLERIPASHVSPGMLALSPLLKSES